MVTFDIFLDFLKAGFPDGTGGVLSSITVGLWKKAVSFFQNENPTEEEFNKLSRTNEDFKQLLTQLASNQEINNYGKIETQINIKENNAPIIFKK